MSEFDERTPRDLAFIDAANILRSFEPALANEIEHGCLRIHQGEPFFVLRAQDISAPSLIEHWALINNPHTPAHKIEDARKIADLMRRYTGPKKDPD